LDTKQKNCSAYPTDYELSNDDGWLATGYRHILGRWCLLLDVIKLEVMGEE